MASLMLKIALAALVVAFVIKVIKGQSARHAAAKNAKAKRINTEGLEIKDATFSEIDKKSS